MTHTQTFIELAIERGLKPKRIDFRHVCFDGVSRNGEMAMFNNCESESEHNLWDEVAVETVLLDPLAWQAVGKVKGWTELITICPSCEAPLGPYEIKHDETHDGCGTPVQWPKMWQWEWKNFIDLLAEGKTIEEALGEILK